jgi:hypothetical protein
MGGYVWHDSMVNNAPQEFHGNSPPEGYTNGFDIIVDPLTAINFGINPDNLLFPPGLLAAFNLLKG